MKDADPTKNYVLGGNVINDFRDGVARFDSLLVTHPLVLSRSPFGVTLSLLDFNQERFVVRITGNTRDGSNWRWTYSFTEVIKTTTGWSGWTDKSGGRTGSNNLYNLIETQNGTTAGGGVLGNGVDVDNLGGLTPQPIPTGTRIEIWAERFGTNVEYWCQYENGIDGTCA